MVLLYTTIDQISIVVMHLYMNNKIYLSDVGKVEDEWFISHFPVTSLSGLGRQPISQVVEGKEEPMRIIALPLLR